MMLSPQSVHVDGPMTSMSEKMTQKKRKKRRRKRRGNHAKMSEYTFNDLVQLGEEVYRMAMWGVQEMPEKKDKANMSAYGRSVLKDPLKKPIPKKPLPPGTRTRIK
jgi:hypothetical protein